MNFVAFRDAVNKRIMKMSKQDLFQVDVSKEELWDTYLNAFPEGTNPIFRERTHHDCNCCRRFITQAGGLVTLTKTGMSTVWDVAAEGEYAVVAEAMAKLIRSKTVINVAAFTERKISVIRNHETLEGGKVHTWNHFYAELPKKFVPTGESVQEFQGKHRDNHALLKRSLADITDSALEIVLDLIDSGTLYRGEEHLPALRKLRKVKEEYSKARKKENFLWLKSVELGYSGRFRNTVIGTLLVDISEGVELEKAVKSFEAKVAPANYKRPKALVTQKMIDQARDKVSELGLEDALARRFARVDDVSVNNVLFADRDARTKMKDAFSDLKPTASAKKPSSKGIRTVSIDDFVNSIMPEVSSLELMVENRHSGNFVSLIAPENENPPRLFKWDNNFSWSYSGEVADSDMRQAVSAQGGRVDGVFRFTHSWNHDKRNASLMDLHVFMPGSNKRPGNDVNDSYGNNQRVGWNHRNHSPSRGVQDVDYTDAAPEGYVPVENITFPDIDKMPEGKYECMVHNWKQRNPTQGGFRAEIEFGGSLYEYEYTKPLAHKEWVHVATVTLKDGKFSIEHHISEKNSSREVWNVSTEQFQKVEIMMHSPNHWDGEETGNKHWFFMLADCVNPDPARGFYNEFLRGELEQHRKVFEVLASKMRTEPSDVQLSGLGFSSTQRNSVICRTTGKKAGVFEITF